MNEKCQFKPIKKKKCLLQYHFLKGKIHSIGILNDYQLWNHLYSLQFPVSAMEVLGETSTNFTFL